jgi:hypothetical protein
MRMINTTEATLSQHALFLKTNERATSFSIKQTEQELAKKTDTLDKTKAKQQELKHNCLEKIV